MNHLIFSFALGETVVAVRLFEAKLPVSRQPPAKLSRDENIIAMRLFKAKIPAVRLPPVKLPATKIWLR